MADTIDARVRAVQTLFETLNTAQGLESKTRQGLFEPGATTDSIEDANASFKLWSGSLGAAHSAWDTRSLEHRLQGTHQVRKRVVELLEELYELLQQAASINEEPREEVNEDVLQELCGDEDQELLEEIRALATSSEMRSTTVLRAVSDCITRLNKLSQLVLNASSTDRWAQAENSTTEAIDSSHYVRHIQEKFRDRLEAGTVESWLLERFGQAIAKRRQYILYCKGHRSRIASQSKHHCSPPDVEPGTYPSAVRIDQELPDRVQDAQSKVSKPSNHMTVASKPCLVPTAATFDFNDGFDDAASCSTVAHSFVGDEDAALLSVPQLIEFAKPRHQFECPYCSVMQSFNGQRGWKKHVFRDIKPYICTFSGCAMLMFYDVKTWFEHEMQIHRRRWPCALCKGISFTSEDKLAEHLDKTHRGQCSKEQRDLILTTSSRPLEEIPANACYLCDWDSKLRPKNSHIPEETPITVTPLRFMRHLGHHQEQMALFALPRSYDDNDEVAEGSLGTARAGAGSEVETLLPFEDLAPPMRFTSIVCAVTCLQRAMTTRSKSFYERLFSANTGEQDSKILRSPANYAPPLLRTSTLQSSLATASAPFTPSATARSAFDPYAMYSSNAKAMLKIEGDLNSMADKWTKSEWDAKRRLVNFQRSQSGSTITATFEPILPEAWLPNSICISCIWWEEKQECYVTIVNVLSLLESLVGVRFTVEEKNRIRRNLEGFRPATVSILKSEEFWRLIMGFPNPRPRNIEKDIKVFPWRILATALKKIIGKYSASHTSILPPIRVNSPASRRDEEMETEGPAAALPQIIGADEEAFTAENETREFGDPGIPSTDRTLDSFHERTLSEAKYADKDRQLGSQVEDGPSVFGNTVNSLPKLSQEQVADETSATKDNDLRGDEARVVLVGASERERQDWLTNDQNTSFTRRDASAKGTLIPDERFWCSQPECGLCFAQEEKFRLHLVTQHPLNTASRVGSIDTTGFLCVVCCSDARQPSNYWPNESTFKGHIRRKHKAWDESEVLARSRANRPPQPEPSQMGGLADQGRPASQPPRDEPKYATTSFTARRPTASNLPNFELPPPPVSFSQPQTLGQENPLYPATSTGSLLTPPALLTPPIPQDPSNEVYQYTSDLLSNILEREFQKEQKPSTAAKKAFADSLNVPLDKVNNWFQNRRAKSKQDAKEAEGENHARDAPMTNSRIFSHNTVPSLSSWGEPASNLPAVSGQEPLGHVSTSSTAMRTTLDLTASEGLPPAPYVPYPDMSIGPIPSHMGAPTSFSAKRPSSHSLPAFELPPPPLGKLSHYQEHSSSRHPAPATSLTSVGNLLTPPSNGSTDGISPASNNPLLRSGVQHFPPYGGGMWPPSTTTSSSYGLTGSAPQVSSQGRGLFSPSLNSIVRERNLPTIGEALPPPPYDMQSYSPMPKSALAGPVTQPSPVHCQDSFARPPPTPSTYYHSQTSSYPYGPSQSAPASIGNAPYTFSGLSYSMPGPVLSNVNNPLGQMTMVGGAAPSFNTGHAAQMHQLYAQGSTSNPQSSRPFKCEQCPQSFNRNHDLKRHKRIHLAIKPFPCGHCDKSFSRKEALKRHVLVKGCGRKQTSKEFDRAISPVPDRAENNPDHRPAQTVTNNTAIEAFMDNLRNEQEIALRMQGAGRSPYVSADDGTNPPGRLVPRHDPGLVVIGLDENSETSPKRSRGRDPGPTVIGLHGDNDHASSTPDPEFNDIPESRPGVPCVFSQARFQQGIGNACTNPRRFISQLRAHHETHGFFYCLKCFEVFGDKVSRTEHEHGGRCLQKCVTRTCPNYGESSLQCKTHVRNSSDDIYRELCRVAQRRPLYEARWPHLEEDNAGGRS